jgi:DNA-binding transcriptional ArsR family regulator
MSRLNAINIDYLNVKKASLVLRALNHKLRQQMVKMLDEKQRMTVTEIYVSLRLEQSVASQHLAILRRAGIVKTEREGKFIYYYVNYDRLEQINKMIGELLS